MNHMTPFRWRNIVVGVLVLLFAFLVYSCVHDELDLAQELKSKGPFLNMRVKATVSPPDIKLYLIAFTSPNNITLPDAAYCDCSPGAPGSDNLSRPSAVIHSDKDELIAAFPNEKESILGITRCQTIDYARQTGRSIDMRGLYFNPKTQRYYFELRTAPRLMVD